MRKLGLTVLIVTCIAQSMAPPALAQESYTSDPALLFEHLRVAIALSAPSQARYQELITLADQAELAYREGSPDVTASALDDIANLFIQELPRADACRKPLSVNVLTTAALIVDSFDLRPCVLIVPQVVRDKRCQAQTCSLPHPGAICVQGVFGCASIP